METIFERSSHGRRGIKMPAKISDVKLDPRLCRDNPAELPEVSEAGVVRHFTALSRLNLVTILHGARLISVAVPLHRLRAGDGHTGGDERKHAHQSHDLHKSHACLLFGTASVTPINVSSRQTLQGAATRHARAGAQIE